MKLEIKKYKFICEGCRKSQIIEIEEYSHHLPEGWGRGWLNGYIMKSAEYCPDCLVKNG